MGVQWRARSVWVIKEEAERERDHGMVRCTREERDNVFHTPWKPESVPTFASKNQ